MGAKAWSEMSRAARTKAKKKLAQQMREKPTPSEARLLKIAQYAAPDALWESQLIVKGYILDVASKRLKIDLEADGGYHDTDVQQAKDSMRDRVLNEAGWEVLRFKNDFVDNASTAVGWDIRGMVARVKARRPHSAKRGNRKRTILAEALHAVVARGCPECASIAADALRDCGYGGES